MRLPHAIKFPDLTLMINGHMAHACSSASIMLDFFLSQSSSFTNDHRFLSLNQTRGDPGSWCCWSAACRYEAAPRCQVPHILTNLIRQLHHISALVICQVPYIPTWSHLTHLICKPRRCDTHTRLPRFDDN